MSVWRGGWRRAPRADGGATAVEYALLVGFVAALIATAVLALGSAVLGLFQSVPPF